MRALDDLVRTGKVLYVANTLAELRGWTAFAAVPGPSAAQATWC
jgi:hypothetical protein